MRCCFGRRVHVCVVIGFTFHALFVLYYHFLQIARLRLRYLSRGARAVGHAHNHDAAPPRPASGKRRASLDL